jgi:pectin methylesterase-like acyl-CoA thioesterase
MSVLTVGTGEEYATIGAAVAAAHSGDTIDVNAGTYTVADLMITQDLTLAAVGGTVDVVGSAGNSKGINVAKGLFVAGSEMSAPNLTIEGFHSPARRPARPTVPESGTRAAT